MAKSLQKELDVLILGGGFAGVYCGKELSRESRRCEEFKVGLVSDENYMVFQPMLPEVAAASISPRHVVSPIRQLCRGIDVYKATVIGIDPSERTVRLNVGDFTPDVVVRYKQLVLALGAKVDLSRVPGMSEHSLLMQNVGDAMKLRAKIIGRFEEANLVEDAALKRRLLSFVVVGGGYSGVETAGEVFDLLLEIHRYYEHVERNDFSVHLIHSGGHLLPTLSRKLGDYCARELEQRGLNLVLNTRVKAVTANNVILSDGERISANTVISTVGNAPHPEILKLAESLELDTDRGRIRTRDTLNLEKHPEIWAAGDCAAVPMESGETCPPTAQFAQRQGTHVGRNLLAGLDNRSPKPFRFKGLGELAAIGHRRAVADIMGFSFSGFLAWWAWRTIYVSKLPGLQKKLRVVMDWTFDLFFPRDINLLSPQYSKPLKYIHLEAGDSLFYPGEPAFSVYFVREGTIEIRDGDQLIKSVNPGEYFGERAILSDRVWHYQAVASKASELVAIGAPEFRAIVEGSTALESLFKRSAMAYGSQQEFDKLKERLDPKIFSARVSDLMIQNPHTLSAGMTFQEALKAFREHSHGSYPVLDERGRYAGVLKRDALYDAIKSSGLDSGNRVGDLPLNRLPLIQETATGEELLERMNRSGKNKLIVTDEHGAFKGLVTVVDILDHGLNK